MKFILAEKKEMTQQFTEDGTVIPVTRVVAGPCVITQVKTAKKDGYTSIQVGFGSKSKLTKPLKGHLKDLGKFRYLKEFKVAEAELEKLSIGKKIVASTFAAGDIIKVTGNSKGKGFQGVVKRHHFHGSPASHGHKDQLRKSGSIGAGGVQNVFKGLRMAGRMGGGQVTITNLEVVKVDPATNEIFIKGAVPGARNNLVMLVGQGDIVIEEIKPEVKVEAKAEEVKEEPKVEQPVEAKVEEVKEPASTDASQGGETK